MRLDGIRNSIVHWAAVVDLGVVGGPDHLKQAAKKFLRPGHSFETEARLTIDDLNKFIGDVNKIILPLLMLDRYLRGEFDAEKREALKKIFLRPIDDQTQEALQQCLIAKEP